MTDSIRLTPAEVAQVEALLDEHRGLTVGDTARITRGPWQGFTGRVTAVFDAGWVCVQLAGMERTFAATEVEAAT